MTKLPPYLALIAASTLLLAGCAAGPTTSTDDGDDTSTSQDDDSTGIDAKGVPCEDNTSGYELSTDPSISSAPEYGQLWGDGSPISFTYDDYTDGTLAYDLGYVQDNGGVIPVTGGFFPDPEGTTFTSSDPLFNSASEGYYGILTLTITTDAGTTELGNYCIVMGLSE